VGDEASRPVVAAGVAKVRVACEHIAGHDAVMARVETMPARNKLRGEITDGLPQFAGYDTPYTQE